jgi:maltose alpha-D-glucosyltransferase/alpha-amylase
VHQRWFAAKDSRIASVILDHLGTLTDGESHFVLTRANVTFASGEEQSYFLPLALSWNEEDLAPGRPLAAIAIAKVRRGSQIGVLCDGQGLDELILTMLARMREHATIESDGGVTSFIGSKALDELEFAAEVIMRRPGDQSNSSIIIGDQAVLKIYRRITKGEHPEVEMARFLTDKAHFQNAPPLLGTIEHRDPDNTCSALAVLTGFVHNQGDGWAFTSDYLNRHYDELMLVETGEEVSASERHALYLEQVKTLARRIGELHLALADETEDTAFAAERIKALDLNTWADLARGQLNGAYSSLERVRPTLDVDVQELVDRSLDRYVECLAVVDGARALRLNTVKTRIHGDLHLGQVLTAQNDFYIIDFEGEPSRSIAERRAKTSPIKDVAGMLRSFDYAVWASLLRAMEHKGEAASALQGPAMAFRDVVQSAFLESYVETVEASRIWPKDPAAADALLNFFLLDKALYEIGYEAASRPDWLRVPLEGLIGILDRLAGEETPT